ncbi:MAG: SCO family protein [Bacillota bacterium]
MKFRDLLPYLGLLVLALAVGVLAGYLTFNSRHQPLPRTDALLLHDPKGLPDFSLTDTAGKTLDKDRLKGRWDMLYFGYRNCPDACPTTLAALNKVLRYLGKLPADKRPQVYFISVDPQRDTPKLLEDYTTYFNPGFVAATGSVDALKALTDPLDVQFSYDKPDAKGDYAVNHSTAVVLVDPDAEEAALFVPPLDPKRMAVDYVSILRYYGEQL